MTIVELYAVAVGVDCFMLAKEIFLILFIAVRDSPPIHIYAYWKEALYTLKRGLCIIEPLPLWLI